MPSPWTGAIECLLPEGAIGGWLSKDGLVEEVSREWPCLGYKKVTSILREEHGQRINPKRVARVRRERGLMASRKGGKSVPRHGNRGGFFHDNQR
jgi:transposase